MTKRQFRSLVKVADEVKMQIISYFKISEAQIQAWRDRAQNLNLNFPKSVMIPVDQLFVDYEIQRDVIHEHVINIMKNWDPRICSPGSACVLPTRKEISVYDAQHRTIAAIILGYTEVPCAVVETDDPNFPSYAFEKLNKTGVRRITPGDEHRNSLVRYANGSRELRSVRARVMQNKFDSAEIDLQDKRNRNNFNHSGSHRHFFSHFKYALKAMEIDEKGQVLYDTLCAIKDVYPMQEEIDQGVYIGLLELHRLSTTQVDPLPQGWQKQILDVVETVYKTSSMVHNKAKVQWSYLRPGASWSAPEAMSNFLREIYIMAGGTINLPFHGKGSTMGILEGNISPGLIPAEFK